MTPRPIYKWKSFWFGILVLVLLGWAWVRSMDWQDWICYGYGGDSRIELGNHTATVEFLLGKSEGVIGTQGFFTLTRRIDDPEAAFEHAIEIIRMPGRFWMQIAHWLLILYFLIPWLSILAWRVWRQRKQRRLTESGAAP
jgi:4-amino-4-deoxy-L-arabinose transferase-like glycosyltransferase